MSKLAMTVAGLFLLGCVFYFFSKLDRQATLIIVLVLIAIFVIFVFGKFMAFVIDQED